MKNRFLITIFNLLFLSVFAQVDNIESFDATTYPPSGWTRTASSTYFWDRVTTSTNPTCLPHSGAGMVQFKCYSASSGATAQLITPTFDLSNIGTNSATVKFWIYRDAGYSTNADRVSVFININPDTIGASLLGTVNRAIALAPVEATAGWYPYSYTYPVQYNGSTNYIIFKGISAFGNNINIDDIVYSSFPQPNDVGISAITSPISGCGLGNATVKARIKNYGGADSNDTIPLKYTVDGTIFIYDTLFYSVPLNGDTLFTFTQTVNMSVPNNYNLTVSTELNGDSNASNNSFTKVIMSIPEINSYPYFQNFEANNGYWTSGGIANSWEYGTPSGTLINSAASGTKCWTTKLSGLYNNSENSYITGPCFNFSSLSLPVIELKIWWEAEFSWDGAALQSSIDGGLSWQHVGNMGDPNNWYNDSTISGLAFSGSQVGWTGRVGSGVPSNGWASAKHDLTGLNGQSNVLLRIAFGSDGSGNYEGIAIDDITIYDKPTSDVGVTAWISPISGCNPSNNIKIKVKNFGSQPSNSVIPVFATIDGGLTYIKDTIFASIPVGLDTVFTLSPIIDVTTINNHICKAYTKVSDDTNPINDTLNFQFVFLSPINTFPFIETFNSGLNYNFDLIKNSQSNAAISSIAPSNFAIKLEGGTSTGWTGSAGAVTATNAWIDNITHISSANTCNVDASGLTSLELLFDLKQIHSGYNPDYSWFRVLANGVQLLDVNGDSVFKPTTESSDIFKQKIFDLTSYVGTQFVIKFEASGKYSAVADAPGDISYVDNIIIREKIPIDLSIIEIISPLYGCRFGALDSVTIKVKNNGGQDISDIPVSYSVNGGTTYIHDTIYGNIATGIDTIFSFSTFVDMNNPAIYNVICAVSHNLDGDALNDSLFDSIKTKGEISSFPFFENFENGVNGYLSLEANQYANSTLVDLSGNKVVRFEGYNSDIGWTGTSTGTTANNAWVTNIGHHGYGYTCNVNATSLTSLELLLDLKQTYTYGNKYSWFRVLVDSVQIADINGISNFNPITESADLFKTLKFNLSAYAGTEFILTLQASGKYSANYSGYAGDLSYIDNVILRKMPDTDLSVTSIISPVTSCGNTANTPIKIKVKNMTSLASNDTIPVSFSINGGTSFINDTIFGTLNSGADTIFTFFQTADLSLAGNYNLIATVSLSGDEISYNDTLIGTVTTIPLINSFPYVESFETSSHFWTSGGTASSWALGTPAATIINSAGDGTKSWVTNLTGNHATSENSYVVSPCFDLSSLIEPFVMMKIWWSSEFSYDGAALQSSIDGGLTWQHIGGVNTSPNWYNDSTISGLAFSGNQKGWTGTGTSGSGGWRIAKHALTGLSGNPQLKLRIAFGSDVSTNYEGFAFDSISIYENAKNKDLKTLAWVSPSSGCGLGSIESITMKVKNNGLDTLYSFDLKYSIDSGYTYITETVNQALLPGDTLIYTFTQTADLSAISTFYCRVACLLIGDEDNTNDLIIKILNNVPNITSFPYLENFESGNGGWISGGVNKSWSLGTPVGVVINSASSGTKAWVTNLSGNYNINENSWVTGPCFNFSSLNNPIYEMKLWWSAENSWDGAAIQYSLNDGANWYHIGNMGDQTNWYNDSTINGLAFSGKQHGWTGSTSSGTPSNGWVTVKHSVPTLAGMPNVKLRIIFGSDGSTVFEGVAFDDVRIYEGIKDLSINSALSGRDSICNLTSNELITVSLTNIGAGIIPVNDSIFMFYSVNNGPIISDTLVLQSNLNIGSSINFTFDQTTDLSPNNIYNIDLYLNYNGDENLLNDTLHLSFESYNLSFDLGADSVDVYTSNLPYTIDAGPGFSSYLWNTASIAQSIIVTAPGWYFVTVTTIDGCSDKDSVFIDVIVKIDDINTEKSIISIYPNPNNGKFAIYCSDNNINNMTIKIYDIQGKIIIEEKLKANFKQFNLEKPNSGVYYIETIANDKININKLIIE